MTEEFKEINERIYGAIFFFIEVIFFALAIHYANWLWIIALTIYSVWFGAYINELGRKANLEAKRRGLM